MPTTDDHSPTFAEDVAALRRIVRAQVDAGPFGRFTADDMLERLDRITAMEPQPSIDSTTGEPLWLCACGDVLPGVGGPQQCVTGCAGGWQQLYVLGGAA